MMFHPIIDYPGTSPIDWRANAHQFIAHLDELKLEAITSSKIEALNLVDHSLKCNEELYQARAIIIAAGARKRRLGVPGEDRFGLAGVSYSATRDHSLYAGKKVAVIGGGDSAVENSLILSRICPRVDLIHRSDHFRARPAWLAEARAAANISIHTGVEVKSIEGDRSVQRLILKDLRARTERPLETEGVFIRLGVAPNSEMFRGLVGMDQDGFILVHSNQETSVKDVYAIGDICRPACFSIATAVGQAAVAAKVIAARR